MNLADLAPGSENIEDRRVDPRHRLIALLLMGQGQEVPANSDQKAWFNTMPFDPMAGQGSLARLMGLADIPSLPTNPNPIYRPGKGDPYWTGQ